MNRLQRAVILADLTEGMRAHGSWCGETHIQKAVYFLQKLLKVPMEYVYILYKHGPFSFDLRDEISEFRVYDLFQLEPQPVPYGPKLRPTPNVKDLKDRFSRTLKSFRNHIDFVAEALDGKGVAELERLATALYVTLEANADDVEARARRIHSLKPHVSSDLALAAIREVDSIRLEAEGLL